MKDHHILTEISSNYWVAGLNLAKIFIVFLITGGTILPSFSAPETHKKDLWWLGKSKAPEKLNAQEIKTESKTTPSTLNLKKVKKTLTASSNLKASDFKKIESWFFFIDKYDGQKDHLLDNIDNDFLDQELITIDKAMKSQNQPRESKESVKP